MTRMRAVALAVTLVFLAGILSPAPARADLDVSFGFFYSNLSPHGSWLVSGQYGRVWQPEVYAGEWNPYYDGHWVFSDVGWIWVSDYSWGAIPYHYGTWVLDPVFGWVWVPGNVWAPAWVVFRTGPDYVGWAPVSPGFSIGFAGSFGAPAPDSFVFVSAGNFVAPRIRTVIVPQSRTTRVFNRTQVVNNLVVENNIVVNRGPGVRAIERASGRKVRELPIERVHGVAPRGGITKADLRFDRQRTRGELRAAAPVSESQPLPTRRRNAGSERRAMTNQTESRERLSGPRSPVDLSPRARTRPETSVAEPREAWPGPRKEARVPNRSMTSRGTKTSPESIDGRQPGQRESKDSTAPKKQTRKQEKPEGKEPEKSKEERRRGGG